MMNFFFVKKPMLLFMLAALMALSCSCMSSGGNPDLEMTLNAAPFMIAEHPGPAVMYDSIRASQVDIDAIYVEGDMEALEKNIDQLIEELLEADINTVFLQAFSDDDGSGNIKSVYFYTTHAPVKADLFNHIAARLKESGFKVIAWMHTLSCQWLFEDNPKNQIAALYKDKAGWYGRATPFSEETWNSLLDLFDDLSKYSDFDGVLFQDDLYMNDYEDFSPYARKAFSEKFHVKLDENILENQDLQDRFSRFKTETLIALTESLMDRVRTNIPHAVSMRNIYSSLITDPDSEEWFAQNYKAFINCYDYTVIMAYPYLEDDAHDPCQWMAGVIRKAINYAGGENKEKIIIKIQTYDWSTGSWLPDAEIENYLGLIENFGLHSAMYPHKTARTAI